MNEQQNLEGPKKPQADDQSSPKPIRSSVLRLLVVPLLILILVILGFGYWQGYALYQRVNEQSLSLRTLPPAIESAANQMAQTDQEIKGLSLAQTELRAAFAEQSKKIERLNQRATSTGLSWQLAEIQTQLRMAGLAINAFQDVGLALKFLGAAKRAAGELDYSGLTIVAKAIHQDMAALAATPEANRTELYLMIDQLRLTIDLLEMRQVSVLVAAPQTVEPIAMTGSTIDRLKHLLQSLLDRLIHLVDFRRGQPALDPLPTQTEEAVLRQNIALSLTSAQIALLRREAVVYQRALDRVESSLDRYFDAQSVDVISALDTLGVLRRAPLSVDLPSVDHSLAALDEARRRLGEDP